jgi:tyrosyl-tRNA synthetase
MQLPDALIRRYFELCTDVPLDQVDARLNTDNPRDSKRWLAREIISLYHPREAAEQADAEWLRVVSAGEVPVDMPEVLLDPQALSAADLLVAAGLAPSKREARRLVEQGALSLDGQVVTDPSAALEIKEGARLKVGKRWRLLRLRS